MGDRGPALVADVLVPLGAILTVVTAVGTVHWLKGKRRLALLAPLSVVSVLGIIGTTRVAKPDSPWARWRYDEDRMSQARARFGGAAVAAQHEGGRTPALVLTIVAVVGGVPLGATTSLVGGVLVGHAVLASAGRVASRRVCVALVVAAAVAQVVVLVVDPAAVPGAAVVLVAATGVALLHLAPPR